jgi:hypothetical protein
LWRGKGEKIAPKGNLSGQPKEKKDSTERRPFGAGQRDRNGELREPKKKTQKIAPKGDLSGQEKEE